MWIGILIGALLGFLSAFGFMSMNIKMSQRDTLFPIVAIMTTVAGAVIGGKIGHKIERAAKIDRALGLDNISFQHYKVGRFWESVSSWSDYDNDEHHIHTFKSGNYVISNLDGKHTMSHDKSASSVNVSKYHRLACNEVFKEIRIKYGEDFLAKYEAKQRDLNP